MTDLSDVFDHTEADTAIPTGHTDLDQLLGGGLYPGTLTAVAGYPGMGASMFALGLARTAAIRHGLGAYLATLESTLPQTMRRIISAEGRVPLHLVTSNLLNNTEWQKLANAAPSLGGAPMHVTERHRDLDAIRRDAEDFGARSGLRLLVVDGAHLLIPAHDYGGRAQFADDFARDLKECAVEAGIAVVATLPLEFPFADRPSHIPLLRDFGKRQSFAAAADVVILLHRDDAYDRESLRAGEADVIVAKSRNSPLATATLGFQPHYARFIDLAAA